MSFEGYFIIFGLIILIILIIISFTQKRKVYLIPGSIIFLFLIVIFVSRFISEDRYTFTYASIKNYDATQSLQIDDFKLVFEDQSEVIYLDTLKNETHLNIYPIYIKELDNYYVVIYSHDKNKRLLYNLYTQDDYELYRNEVDLFTLISKTDGVISMPRVYNLIGSTIDLNQILSKDETIILPIYKPFKSDINYYYLIQEIQTSTHKYFKNDIISLTANRKIERFEFLDNKFITLFDNGDIHYEIHTQTALSESQGHIGYAYSKSYYDILDDKTFVKEGYFTTHNNQFYILDDDMFISLLEDKILTKVKLLDNKFDFFNEVNLLA